MKLIQKLLANLPPLIPYRIGTTTGQPNDYLLNPECNDVFVTIAWGKGNATQKGCLRIHQYDGNLKIEWHDETIVDSITVPSNREHGQAVEDDPIIAKNLSEALNITRELQPRLESGLDIVTTYLDERKGG